jgi:hypothetical protein
MARWYNQYINSRGRSSSGSGGMKTRFIRCGRGFASAYGRWNIEVFFAISGFGYGNRLFTCIECGELFVVDFENPALFGRNVEQIAMRSICPKCGRSLAQTICPYPENFHIDDGRIGHFEVDRLVQLDSETLVKEFFVLPEIQNEGS